MCCRYYMEMSPELRPIVEEAARSPLASRISHTLSRPLIKEGEVRPTDIAPVLAPDRSGERAVFPMAWGFRLPRSASPLVNARVETAGTKPTFKESWERRRCVIPASHYYEWEHLVSPATGKTRTGDKYMIRPKDSGITWLAGFYRIEERSGIRIPVFTVLAREPGDSIRFIHNRMPVILPEEAAREWIRPGADPEQVVREAITDMAFEKMTAT